MGAAAQPPESRLWLEAILELSQRTIASIQPPRAPWLRAYGCRRRWITLVVSPERNLANPHPPSNDAIVSTETLTELLRLPSRQRLAIAEQLWLSVADEQSMAVPAEHRRVVQDRLRRYKSGEAKVLTHKEIMRRARAK